MWFFLSPKIVFGEDALQELSQIQGKKAFVVTDRVLENLGLSKLIMDQLSEAGIETAVFSDVEPDPELATVYRCAAQIESFAPDWVIGFGGGSCLDAAKAAWFIYECPDIPLEAINPFELFGLRSKAKFAAISTTSGTGADVSWRFALRENESGSKLVRVSRELIPDLAIVDPQLVNDLPASVTADAGMDVLAHAVEAYTNNWFNDFTDGLALKSIELVFKYLPAAYQDGSNQEAREHMHNAATMAGLAFSNTAIIIAHSLAHAAGARFHTHHGRTVGMFLPYTIEFNAAVAPQRYVDIAHFLHLPSENPQLAVQSLVSAIRKLAASLDQPLSLQEFGISRQEFDLELPFMIENALASLELLANPRQPSSSEIENLFIYAYEAKQVDF